MDNWKDIPGYDGMYQINEYGHVRSWKYRGGHGQHPTPLKWRRQKNGTCSIKLVDSAGKVTHRSVVRHMADVWLGGVPENHVAYNKNGVKTDCYIGNIGIRSKSKHQKDTGQINRKPVEKTDENGAVVAVYPSLEAAAAANYMTPSAVSYYCYGKNKKLLDGKYTFQFTDPRLKKKVRKCSKRKSKAN